MIALYVIFLDLRWRGAVAQAGLAVASHGRRLCVDPAAGPRRAGHPATEGRIITGSRIIAVLFGSTLLTIGASAATTGMLSTFLAELRGAAPLTATRPGDLPGRGGRRPHRDRRARSPNRLRQLLVILFALSAGMLTLLFLVDLGPLTLPAVFLAGLALSAQTAHPVHLHGPGVPEIAALACDLAASGLSGSDL